jgi:hypothetical protein
MVSSIIGTYLFINPSDNYTVQSNDCLKKLILISPSILIFKVVIWQGMYIFIVLT